MCTNSSCSEFQLDKVSIFGFADICISICSVGVSQKFYFQLKRDLTKHRKTITIISVKIHLSSDKEYSYSLRISFLAQNVFGK